MIGLGTLINTAAIAAGGLLGAVFGRVLKENVQDTLMKACGISTLFLGIAGALEGMLKVSGNQVESDGAGLVVGCLALGGLVGELLGIEAGFERFGVFLREKTGNGRDSRFVDAFVTASLTVCIGAMAIVGSIADGISGDYSILATKAVLDLIIIMVMSSSMGKGAVFSLIPVAVLQGSITLMARWIAPWMTAAALSNLSLVGNVLIFCVGINLVWGKVVRVANFLPAVAFAVLAAFLPL